MRRRARDAYRRGGESELEWPRSTCRMRCAAWNVRMRGRRCEPFLVLALPRVAIGARAKPPWTLAGFFRVISRPHFCHSSRRSDTVHHRTETHGWLPLPCHAPRCRLLGAQDLILPVAIIASVLVILVPLPAALMDVLLAANIARRGDHAADDDLRPHAAGVQHLSLAAAGDHARPAGAQRRHDAADPHARRQRRACWRPAAWSRASASSWPATRSSSG